MSGKITALEARVAELERRLENRAAIDELGALPAYRLLREMPQLAAGTIFVHDEDDQAYGSIACGSMHNAWVDGNCQSNWCGGTHTLPGQLARDTKWFERVPNSGRYTSGRKRGAS